MTTFESIPNWWAEAEKGVNAATKDFVIRMETELTKLRPIDLLKKKSPFLSCIRAPNSVEELAANMVNDWLSSSAETVLGNVIEEATVAVCAAAKNGRKATAEGMDIEFEHIEQGRNVLSRSSQVWAKLGKQSSEASIGRKIPYGNETGAAE